jgi:hypothetical protein
VTASAKAAARPPKLEKAETGHSGTFLVIAAGVIRGFGLMMVSGAGRPS